MTTTSTGEVPWITTGGNGDLSVSRVSTDPAVPVAGKDVTVTLEGTLKKALTGGTTSITVKYGMITLARHEEGHGQAKYGESLPAPVGPYTTRIAFPLSADSPKGKYTVDVTLTDQGNTEIARGAFTVSL